MTRPGVDIKALVFDVFGTVVDWRRSIAAEGRELGRRLGLDADWEGLADAWRGRYQPSMERVRSGERPWARLDDLHLESLRALLPEFGLEGMPEAEILHFNRAWHRLEPWPDSVPGLTRLKVRYILATLSNGNVALLLNMARHAGLPWDTILGAEPARAYKPLPQAYLRTVEFLGLEPGEVMLVAAHNDDLVAARECGLRTAFIPRPTEYGPHQVKDFDAEHDFDVVAEDMQDLATRLGC
jgi:2-haloacid dehalogenase